MTSAWTKVTEISNLSFFFGENLANYQTLQRIFEENYLEPYGVKFLGKNKLIIRKKPIFEKIRRQCCKLDFFWKEVIDIKRKAKWEPFMRFYQVI